MITLATYKYTIKSLFNNKLVVQELYKAYEKYNDEYEINGFFIDRKHVGLLLMKHSNNHYVLKFTKSPLKPDMSGRTKPVICDLCFTRQAGSKVSNITFVRESDSHTFTWLLCSDLMCSVHARGISEESKESVKILGENVSVEKRIIRLEKHIAKMVNTLQLVPLKGAM